MKKPIAALVSSMILSGALGSNQAHASDPVDIARQSIGEPYRWGDNDCSGFTKKVFAKLGISLPHHSAAQAAYGVPVSKDNLKPGDLVFFNTTGKGISHVGIYVGGGSMISSENERTDVRETKIFGEGKASYWESRYVSARRIIGLKKSSDKPTQKVVKRTQKQKTTVNQQPSQETNLKILYRYNKKVSKTPSIRNSYTVQAGDSLWEISRASGISVAKIQEINHLDSITIHPSQKLLLKERTTPLIIRPVTHLVRASSPAPLAMM